MCISSFFFVVQYMIGMNERGSGEVGKGLIARIETNERVHFIRIPEYPSG